MIKAFFKGRKLRVEFEKEFDSWEMGFEPEHLVRRAQWELEGKIKDEILKLVERKMQAGILDKIADELLASYDFKPVIESAMKDSLKNYLVMKGGQT